MWWIIAVAIITFVIVIIILFWFRDSGGRAFDGANSQIDSLGDYDGDKVANMFDKCVCVPGDVNAELDGCPLGTTKDSAAAKQKLTEDGCVDE